MKNKMPKEVIEENLERISLDIHAALVTLGSARDLIYAQEERIRNLYNNIALIREQM